MTTAPIRALSAVGSGDAFLAGLATAFSLGGYSLDNALRWGAAAGAANALTHEQGQFTREQVVSAFATARIVAVGDGTESEAHDKKPIPPNVTSTAVAKADAPENGER